jgi:7,8-dihydroneopterin aldolase/epimerase/oxygenase
MIVELYGLHIFGYHGVEEDEQRLGQPFLFDIKLEVADERAKSDLIADVIDYSEVAAAAREVSSSHRYNLLEALATATADTLYARFRPDRVSVRVRKPNVKPAGLTVEFSAVTVERP